YDVTGGRYEERDHAATGSGSLHADTVVKLGFRPSMTRAAAVDLVLDALYVASDADSATGGPDPVRDVFPVVAVIDADGYVRLDDAELRRRTERLLRRHRSRREGDEGGAS
ncbi:MAG: proteasome subunit beta, partial [Acidimicrobiaceae bacterium]|nr:proteasome subunit beta [Acidimicrobiaceae bacterium]